MSFKTKNANKQMRQIIIQYATKLKTVRGYHQTLFISIYKNISVRANFTSLLSQEALTSFIQYGLWKVREFVKEPDTKFIGFMVNFKYKRVTERPVA